MRIAKSGQETGRRGCIEMGRGMGEKGTLKSGRGEREERRREKTNIEHSTLNVQHVTC
jgi:hypothetical protein